MCTCELGDVLLQAKRVGRAHYVCPKCGDDISMKVVLLADAVMMEEELKNGKQKREYGPAAINSGRSEIERRFSTVG